MYVTFFGRGGLQVELGDDEKRERGVKGKADQKRGCVAHHLDEMIKGCSPLFDRWRANERFDCV